MSLNLKNTIKALIVCALVNVIYTFYVSSSALQSQLSVNGRVLGKIEAFTSAAETTIGFWPHIIESWAYGFGISFISCVLLLGWMTLKAPNKSLSPDAQERAG